MRHLVQLTFGEPSRFFDDFVLGFLTQGLQESARRFAEFEVRPEWAEAYRLAGLNADYVVPLVRREGSSGRLKADVDAAGVSFNALFAPIEEWCHCEGEP